MSNIVEQLVDSINTRLELTLGSDYKKLPYVFNIANIDLVRNKKRYGNIPLSAESTATPNKYFTVDHTFQVILTDEYKNVGSNDNSQMSKLLNLYDKMDDITADLYNSKLGLPGKVWLTTLDSYEEPEFLDEDNVVALRANFIVKYRTQL